MTLVSVTDRLFENMMRLDRHVRYVAVFLDGRLESRQRAGLDAASSSDAEAIESVLRSPAGFDGSLMRGSATRGGVRQVVIRPGQFWQVAMACRGGKVAIGLDHGVDPLEVAAMASDVLLGQGL